MEADSETTVKQMRGRCCSVKRWVGSVSPGDCRDRPWGWWPAVPRCRCAAPRGRRRVVRAGRRRAGPSPGLAAGDAGGGHPPPLLHAARDVPCQQRAAGGARGALRGAGALLRARPRVPIARALGGENSRGTDSRRAVYPEKTGGSARSRVVNHTPVAAVSLIIFSQCLSVCFCIKHEVKQEVGGSFSFRL